MEEYMYTRAAHALLLIVFLFCGVLRSCNFWRFSGRDVAALYPARHEASAAYFAVLLLLPCVLFPLTHPATRVLVRCFWILYIPLVTYAALSKLFFKEIHDGLRLPSPSLMGIASVIILGLLSFLACLEEARPVQDLMFAVVGLMGIFLGFLMIRIIIKVFAAVFCKSKTHSDADGFPRRFTIGISSLPLIAVIMAWMTFVADSPRGYTVIALTCAIAGMAILAVILHPQRKKESDVDGHEITVVAIRSDRKGTLSEAQLDKLERQIRGAVEKQNLYLDPNLNRNTLKEKLDINHSYLSEVFAMRFGSLTRYVNLLRMKYALRYIDEHPRAKLTEVARNSGFGSMNTFYRTKKLYEAGELD